MEGGHAQEPARDQTQSASGGVRSYVDSSGLHGVGGEKSRRKQGPGEVRDPLKASCSGWGQQWALRQAGTGPLKLRKNALGAAGTAIVGEAPPQCASGVGSAPGRKLRPSPGAGGWRRAPAVGWPGPPSDAFNFFCSLGLFRALFRKLSPVQPLRTLRKRRAA